MQDFVKELKNFQRDGKFKGIESVYLCILWADVREIECTKRYIASHVSISPSLVELYLAHLSNNKYIFKRPDGTYTTAVTEQSKEPKSVSKAYAIAQDAKVPDDKRAEVQALVSAIARKGNYNKEMESARKVLVRYGNFLNLTERDTFDDFIRFVAQRESFCGLDKPRAVQAELSRIKESHAREAIERENLLTRSIKDASVYARRIAENIKRFLDSAPDRCITRNSVSLKEFKRLYGNRIAAYPHESAPEEMVIQELRKLNYIVVGGQHGTQKEQRRG